MADVNHVIPNFRRQRSSDSVNFVPPEGVGECVRPSTEPRLPHNHSCEEGKLQVKEMDPNATSQAVERFNTLCRMYTNINNVTRASAPASVPGEMPSFEDMLRQLERNKFIVETKSHLFDRCTRAFLLREIPILIHKINSVVVPSSPCSSTGSNTATFTD